MQETRKVSSLKLQFGLAENKSIASIDFPIGHNLKSDDDNQNAPTKNTGDFIVLAIHEDLDLIPTSITATTEYEHVVDIHGINYTKILYK